MKNVLNHSICPLIAMTVCCATEGGVGVASTQGSGGSVTDRRSAATPSAFFKKSHVPAWFDGPDDHRSYDVDVLVQDFDIVAEADLPRWQAFVQQQHSAGKLVCAEMRPLTHIGKMLEYVMNDPTMQVAVCRDLELKPIAIPWMKEHPYNGRVPPFYCSNHPDYRAFLRQQIRLFAAASVDGVMVDDGGGSPLAFSQGGCFCEHCLKGFREYLKGRYSAEQLRQQGVDSLEPFDYRQFILNRCGDTAAYLKAKREKAIPFNSDFQRFLRDSDVELFRSLQALASQLSGRHIPMGWDNVDFGGQYAPYYPFWDVFYAEITHQNFHVNGPGPGGVFPQGIVYLNKLADVLGKWYTPTPGPRSWQAIMGGNLTGLLRQWIAFTYANGGAMRYPRKGWVFSESTPWYYPPKAEFEPVYAFVRTHRQLLGDYEPVQQVGVLYTQTASGAAAAYYTPLKHVCAQLVEHNIPFGLAVAGDELLANRLKGNEADRFELMLIPEPIRLIDGQQEIVERWKSEGKAVAVKASDDVAAKLNGRVKPLVAVESDSKVWLFPRTTTDKTRAPLVCHVVNAQYDAKQNQMVRQDDVVVCFSDSLWNGPPPNEVTYHTIGRPARVLPVVLGAGKASVTIPDVDLWGILAFASQPESTAQAEGWSELFDGATLNGWVQKNGTATYRVVDGTIVGRTAEGSWNAFLCTEKECGDFELEFEVKVDARLNSGVQIRSKTREKTIGPGLNNAAGCVNGPNAGDANTPSRISKSSDVGVSCMYGNVKKLEDRPMLEVVDSTDIVVSQLKAFQPGSFPHLTETFGSAKHQILSSKICALFVRHPIGGAEHE